MQQLITSNYCAKYKNDGQSDKVCQLQGF